MKKKQYLVLALIILSVPAFSLPFRIGFGAAWLAPPTSVFDSVCQGFSADIAATISPLPYLDLSIQGRCEGLDLYDPEWWLFISALGGVGASFPMGKSLNLRVRLDMGVSWPYTTIDTGPLNVVFGVLGAEVSLARVAFTHFLEFEPFLGVHTYWLVEGLFSSSFSAGLRINFFWKE